VIYACKGKPFIEKYQDDSVEIVAI